MIVSLSLTQITHSCCQHSTLVHKLVRPHPSLDLLLAWLFKPISISIYPLLTCCQHLIWASHILLFTLLVGSLHWLFSYTSVWMVIENLNILVLFSDFYMLCIVRLSSFITSSSSFILLITWLEYESSLLFDLLFLFTDLLHLISHACYITHLPRPRMDQRADYDQAK